MSVNYCYEYPRPALTVDIVVFRRSSGGESEVLLIKRKGEPYAGWWAFPGGYVEEMEPLERAAARELEEETGLKVTGVEQIAAFGDPGRDPRGHSVSIAFTTLLDASHEVKAADDAAEVRWFSVSKVPHLAFDHDEMLEAALKKTRVG